MLPETMVTYNVLFIALGLVLGATLIAYEQRVMAEKIKLLETEVSVLVMERNRFWKIVGMVLETSEAEEVVKKLATRRRRRYIVFYVASENPKQVTPEGVEEALREAARKLYGTLGVGDMYPQLVYFDEKLLAGIVRTTHQFKYHVIAAMGFVRTINGARASIIPVATTGTIKRAKKLLMHGRRVF